MMHRCKEPHRLQCDRLTAGVWTRDHEHSLLAVEMQVHRHHWRCEERVACLGQEQFTASRIVGVEPVPISRNVGNRAGQIKEGEVLTVRAECRRIRANQPRERPEDPRLFSGDRGLRLSHRIAEINNL